MEKQKVISFCVEKDKKYMTVGELHDHLEKFDRDLIVVLSSDEEGNNYSALYEGRLGVYDLDECEFEGYDDTIDNAESANCIALYP